MSEGIRTAVPKDAPGLLDIYARYIDTPTTFETELPSLEDFARRVDETLSEYPFLVYEQDRRIIGYAYAHRLRERAAYQWSAELSVYLLPEAFGRGVARALYTELISILRKQRVQMVYGAITEGNPASVRFHEKMGFTLLGIFHRAGFKCGRWLDMLWYEKRIGCEGPPEGPLLPFPCLSGSGNV